MLDFFRVVTRVLKVFAFLWNALWAFGLVLGVGRVEELGLKSQPRARSLEVLGLGDLGFSAWG